MLPPESGLVYDYLYEREGQRWVPWYDTIDKERLVIPPDAKVTTPTPPTVTSHADATAILGIYKLTKPQTLSSYFYSI